jgi:hypothetical protein
VSFALWFILLGLISLGIGALLDPWLEMTLFRIVWLPGVLISGAFRYAGARLAGLPVSQVRFVRGHGRGIRVDTAKGGIPKVLLLSLVSYVGPLVLLVVANLLWGRPLRLDAELPQLHLDSRALVQFGTQGGAFLQEIGLVLVREVPRNPSTLVALYLFVAVLMTNTPGKGESYPLWGTVLVIAFLHTLGLALRPGSKGFLASVHVWSGLGLVFGLSLLTLVLAGFLGVIHRARHGRETGKAR